MKIKVDIRKANKKDLIEMAEIFRIESSKKPYDQKWTKKTALEKVKKCLKEQDVFVTIVEDKIVGFITSYREPDNKNKAYVDEFWISKEFQGRGIGRKVMQFVEKFYKAKGVEMIHLVAGRKAGAYRFYRKLNYKESEESVFLEKVLK